MPTETFYTISVGHAFSNFIRKPDPMTEEEIWDLFSAEEGNYEVHGDYRSLKEAMEAWDTLSADTYAEKGAGKMWVLRMTTYLLEEVTRTRDEDGDIEDDEFRTISKKAEPYQTESAVKLAHLRTLRRLIDQNDTDIIDAIIDVDVANMKTLDPHWNHAVVVHTCGGGSLDISLTTVKAPGSTGVCESGWIVYVSRMGGDDLSEWLASTGVQLPDDDDPDYNSKRAEVIGAAMDSYRESAFYEDYEDILGNAIKELNAEIIRAEHNGD